MSQTETILLIVLGFSLASLIALFASRLLWSLAVRTGARRMQRQVPTSLIGLQTERDRLRAEYAMLAQRMGAQLEAARLEAAEHLAEVSRQRNRVMPVEAAEAARNEELHRLTTRVAELETALAETTRREEHLRRAFAAQEEELTRLRSKRKAAKAAKSAAAEAPPAPPPPAPDDPETRLRQRIDRLTELARSQPDGPVPPPPRPPEEPVIAEKLAEAERQTDALTRDLERLDAEWQQRLATPPLAEGEADENVISLSNRIRDLKKNIGSGT